MTSESFVPATQAKHRFRGVRVMGRPVRLGVPQWQVRAWCGVVAFGAFLAVGWRW